ncbi:hypothetical protein [Actinoallomurus soli]|uniref:hypothetical protein n=1 Tax=Actinoallomurus soli TaxID=2952535 RepID=UPI002092ED2B|nr:hypothetical protein [Actinoallomurus soli]MCO5968962.1 hypothetical protein [Actinoallomurus soli]
MRGRLPAVCAAASLLLTGCGHAPARTTTVRFASSGVEVTLAVSRTTVRGVYRPTRAGFHLYSIGLPQGGIDGLGVPTSLRVRGGLVATGTATANETPRTLSLPALGVRLPVYPDGPVTVTLPVRRTGRTADVVVSYGACSAVTCLAPVIDHRTVIRLR